MTDHYSTNQVRGEKKLLVYTSDSWEPFRRIKDPALKKGMVIKILYLLSGRLVTAKKTSPHPPAKKATYKQRGTIQRRAGGM